MNPVHWVRRIAKKSLGRLWSLFLLRKCTLHGTDIWVKGRPMISARGDINVGDNVSIHSNLHRVQLSSGPGATLEIGPGTFINNGTVISARKQVKIGSNCQIGPRVVIMDCDFHGVDDRDQDPPTEPIVLGNNVWLATGVIVLKGVTIGDGSVVAAGAVVTKDVPPYTLVGGVPARTIRTIQQS